jgi:hypothetical protein
MEPIVSGVADLAYLKEALARAGEPPFFPGELSTQTLGDGRMGASVTRLTVIATGGERRSFVLKVAPASGWRTSIGLDATEARIWLSGATRTLPAGVRSPTLDVARHAERAEWWILMEDVSEGILPRGTYDEAKARALLRAIARLHARFWERDEELAASALPSSASVEDGLARLTAHLVRGEPPADPGLAGFAQDFWVARTLLPVFLDALRSEDADFYRRLCGDHARITRALARYPRTFIHGDLRRANISFVGDDVVLFDWERAACGPAARDLEWYWFLQFWAYPPADGRASTDRRTGLDVYLDTLDRERGSSVERAAFEDSCDLAWLSVFCQLGFCLADPLTEPSVTAEAATRARHVMAEAIDLARRIQDRHVR